MVRTCLWLRYYFSVSPSGTSETSANILELHLIDVQFYDSMWHIYSLKWSEDHLSFVRIIYQRDVQKNSDIP